MVLVWVKSPFCDQSMAAEADWAGQVFPKKENLKQMVPPGSAGGSFTAYMYMRRGRRKEAVGPPPVSLAYPCRGSRRRAQIGRAHV